MKYSVENIVSIAKIIEDKWEEKKEQGIRINFVYIVSGYHANMN